MLGRHLEAGRGAQCSPAPAPRYPRGYPQRTQLRSDSRAHAYLRAHLSEPHMRTAPRPSTPDSALGNDRDTAAEGHAGGCAAASSRGLRAGAALLSRDMAPRRRARRGWKAGAPRFAPQPPPRGRSPSGGCRGSAVVWFPAVPPPPSRQRAEPEERAALRIPPLRERGSEGRGQAVPRPSSSPRGAGIRWSGRGARREPFPSFFLSPAARPARRCQTAGGGSVTGGREAEPDGGGGRRAGVGGGGHTGGGIITWRCGGAGRGAALSAARCSLGRWLAA